MGDGTFEKLDSSADVSSWSEYWDKCWLGPEWIPGVVTVSLTMDSGLDVKKPRKAKKAKVVDEGVHPAKISIEVELLPHELHDFYIRVVPMLRPVASDAPRDPLRINHPNTKLWGVDSVMIGDIGSPQPTQGGTMIITIGAIEWKPSPIAQRKSKAKPAGDSGEANQSIDDLINELRPGANGGAAANFSSPDQNQSIDPT